MLSRKVIKSVSVILKPRSVSEYTSILPNLYNWLSKRKVTVYFEDKEASRPNKIFNTIPKNVQLLNEKEILTESDLILSLGVDEAGRRIIVC